MPTITITLEPAAGDAIREMAWLDIATALEEIGDVGMRSSAENLLAVLPEVRTKLDQVEERVAPFGVSDGQPQEITVDKDRLLKLAKEALDECGEDVSSAVSTWEGDRDEGARELGKVTARPLALSKLLEKLGYKSTTEVVA